MRHYNEKSGKHIASPKEAAAIARKRLNDKLGTRDIGLKEIESNYPDFAKQNPAEEAGKSDYNDSAFLA